LGLVSYLSKIPIHHTCSLDFRRWIPQIDGREPANVATLSLVGAAACLYYYEPSLRPWAPARFPAAGSRSQRLTSRALVIVHFPLFTGRSPPTPKHPPPCLPLCLWALSVSVFFVLHQLSCALCLHSLQCCLFWFGESGYWLSVSALLCYWKTGSGNSYSI